MNVWLPYPRKADWRTQDSPTNLLTSVRLTYPTSVTNETKNVWLTYQDSLTDLPKTIWLTYPR
jgi:hypothetical protein